MIGFDLAQSDLPLKVEFPILLANSIAWLAGRDALTDDRAVRAGQPALIRTTQSGATITTPTGDAQEVAARDGSIIFADTMRVGAYQVNDSQAVRRKFVERIGIQYRAARFDKTRTGEVSGQVETFNSEREAWRWVALAVLAVLTIEWWVYHRRITSSAAYSPQRLAENTEMTQRL